MQSALNLLDVDSYKVESQNTSNKWLIFQNFYFNVNKNQQQKKKLTECKLLYNIFFFQKVSVDIFYFENVRR